MAQHDRYISPFSTRYASDEMQYIFSDDNKFRTWRKLWIALAKAEQKQGLAITDEQLAELEAHKDDINYEDAIAREKLVRHDVMSHVYAYGLQCPKAKGIIHLGATSCYVGDNTDVIVMREALQLVRKKIIGVLANLAKFADEYKAMPCLAYTHCQPAQLTTVGKRATLWMNELYMDLESHRLPDLPAGAARRQGHHRHPGQLYGAVQRRLRQDQGRRGRRLRPDGLYQGRAGLRPDVQPQGGLQRPVRRGGSGPVCHEDGDRHPPAGKLQGNGGAVREEPDRFLRHALQAQPHALRAHLRA